MHFESFADFLHMGGHAFYVWLCYGIVLVSLILTYVISWGGVDRSKKMLDRYYARVSRRENSSEENAFSNPEISD